MELYLKLIDVLFPVFFVIGVGYYLGKKDRKFDTTFITNFAGNIGTPAMIFYTITTTGVTLDIFIEYFIYAVIIICGFAAYLRNITLRPNIFNDWMFFLLTILVATSINYFLLLTIFAVDFNYYDLLGNIIFTFLLYYIFSYIFDFYRKLVFKGKQND